MVIVNNQLPYLLNIRRPSIIKITQGVWMSKKRMMSKQQRLYYEQNRKERVREELVEYIKDKHSLEKIRPDGLAKNILY